MPTYFRERNVFHCSSVSVCSERWRQRGFGSRPSRWCNFGCGRGPSSGGFGGDVYWLIFLLDHGLVEFGHAFDLHVSVLELPLVVLLHQHSPDEADDAVRSEERRVGKECSVRVDLGGRRIIKNKKKKKDMLIYDHNTRLNN